MQKKLFRCSRRWESEELFFENSPTLTSTYRKRILVEWFEQLLYYARGHVIVIKFDNEDVATRVDVRSTRAAEYAVNFQLLNHYFAEGAYLGVCVGKYYA